MIKIVPKNTREIEEKHWEWFRDKYKNKINNYIKLNKIGENKIDERIIEFLKDINNDEVLEVIVKGKITNEKLDIENDFKNKKLSDLATLDQMMFCIIHKYPKLFDTKKIYINAINQYLGMIEKYDLNECGSAEINENLEYLLRVIYEIQNNKEINKIIEELNSDKEVDYKDLKKDLKYIFADELGKKFIEIDENKKKKYDHIKDIVQEFKGVIKNNQNKDLKKTNGEAEKLNEDKNKEDYQKKYKEIEKYVKKNEIFTKNKSKLRDKAKKKIREILKLNTTEKHDENLKELNGKILKEIFNYDKFIKVSENDKVWDAYKLVKALDVRTCPYCNRSYTHTYNMKDGKCRPELDHYYPKSIYPFLAVSLYNFIPSCHVCNASFKGSIDTFLIKHIYPFEEDFVNSAKFETKFFTDDDYNKKETDEKIKDNEKYDVDYLLGLSDNFKIDIDSKGQHKVENSINMFKLDKLYQFHKDYVQEIIRKSIVYNESRVNELLEDYPELFNSKNDIVQFISGNYTEEKDLNKRPLSKLTKDICEEFGLK